MDDLISGGSKAIPSFPPIAEIGDLLQIVPMRAAPLSIALLLAACHPSGAGEDVNSAMPAADAAYAVRAEFLAEAAGDAWVNWPTDLAGHSADEGKPCTRVAENVRQAAIDRLARHPAIRIDREEYEQLTGAAAPTGDGALYLLRGFSTSNSVARVKVIGEAVIVRSDALGGLLDLRRHPCIASLMRPPSTIYTMAAYDL